MAESEPRAVNRRCHRFTIGKSNFVVDIRYVNLKPIGSGSYGVVCSAEDRLTGRQVAIKKVTDVFSDLIDAKRILREIKLLHHLGKHENIIELYDLMTYPPETEDFRDLYIVTELFECDLDRIISSSQPLTDGHIQFFVYQVLRALLWIHSAHVCASPSPPHVLHRDLKPLNLLVNANCDLAICDFGLARGMEKEEAKMTEYVVTRWYRAPELLCDNQVYDAKVDVWSVGCIFAETLVRKPLLKGRDYMHQLGLIIDLLGPPGDGHTEFIINPDARAAIRAMRPSRSAMPLKERFSSFSPTAVDFLSRMLVFDPNERADVKSLLRHPYLADIHHEEDEPECPREFNFEFERGYPEEMPRNVLQYYMYHLMLDLREEDRRARMQREGAQEGSGSRK